MPLRSTSGTGLFSNPNNYPNYTRHDAVIPKVFQFAFLGAVATAQVVGAFPNP